MGRFENIVLGDVSGKVGNIVGRKRKGKHFVYVVPTEVKISNSPEAIKSRDIMIPLAKFASIVNSIPELKYIWTDYKLEAFDAFHKIEKVNFPFLIPERPTTKNTITPFGFVVNPIISARMSPTGINIRLVMNKENAAQLEGAKELTGIGVICNFNPKSKESEYFQLSKIRTSQFEAVVDEEIEIVIPFNEEVRGYYNSYLNSILYFAFVTKDINGTPIKVTNSRSFEFAHEITADKERFRMSDSRA